MEYKQRYSDDQIWQLIGKKKAAPKKKTSLEKALYKCPKFEICLMDCHHREPHPFDKWCDPKSDVNKEKALNGNCECPKCVEELKADITFFPEDFEIR